MTRTNIFELDYKILLPLLNNIQLKSLKVSAISMDLIHVLLERYTNSMVELLIDNEGIEILTEFYLVCKKEDIKLNTIKLLSLISEAEDYSTIIIEKISKEFISSCYEDVFAKNKNLAGEVLAFFQILLRNKEFGK